MAYILLFVISTALVYCSERLYKNGKGRLSAVVGILMVVAVSIFAGMRAIGVGTDTEYYLVNHYNLAQEYRCQFPQFVSYMYGYEEVDLLYIVLVYISANVFKNIHVLMFVLSLITNLFVYLALVKKRNQASVATEWMIYCFIFYNTSLNIMRQSCAIAILFYAMVAYDEKKISIKNAIALGIMAFCFHRSAILAMVILLAIFLFNSKKEYRRLLVAITLILCAFPFVFEITTPLVKNLTILPIRYRIYFDIENSEQATVLLETIIYAVPTIGLLVSAYKCREKNINQYTSLGLICMSSYLRTNLIMSRLSYYFIIFFAVSVPASAKIIADIIMKKKKELKVRVLYEAMIILCFAFLWGIDIVWFNYGQTYPYMIG